MKCIIATNNAPAANGPYSQGVSCTGDIIFVSGQTPIDPASGIIETDNIADQARQSLKNIEGVLKAVGLSLDNVVKTTCFITDMGNFSEFNKVYSEFFKDNCPARSCVEVSKLPKNSLCEVEAIAIR